MARVTARAVAVSLLAASGVRGFSPFAGVDELKPQRLEEHCGSETFPSKDGKFQLRKCQQQVTKRLEDGGDVTLDWVMHVDPSSILSLDTEAEHGVQLKGCSPTGLELELPESHARHATEGNLIIGSRFAHSCEHLGDKHLYHRVKEVQHHQWQASSKEGAPRRATVRLLTEELPNFAHAVEFLSFNFTYMPVEARDTAEFPEMRTDFGTNRDALRRAQAAKQEEQAGRRLSILPSFSDMVKKMESMKPDGVEEDTGGFQHGGTSKTQISTKNDLLNFMPKQVSNFGWNWDFYMNSTQEPEIKLEGPGTKGFFTLKQPYIKVHAGIYVNFTSQFYGPFTPPHVQWTAGINGRGRVQGRIIAALNTTGDAKVDATSIKTLDLPILERLRDPIWFNKIEFSTGNMPISVEPGWQVKAQLYHQGEFKGAAVFGGKTHGTVHPRLIFDSVKGFEYELDGELLDTDVWPPMWIIFTKRFEMGVMLRPSLLMRGDMFGLEKATAAGDVALYFNLTVKRESNKTAGTGGTAGGPAGKKLTVYPFRVMGLDNVELHTRYKVKITVGSKTITTDPAVNWGEVMYREHVSKFDFGALPEESILQKGITVSLIEVRDSADPLLPSEGKELGQGVVTCSSLLEGQCRPSPSIANIVSPTGQVVASVQLAIMYTDVPETFLASKIRGVSISFPQVVLRQDALAGKLDTLSTAKPTLHLIQGGKTFIANVVGDVFSQQTPLAGDKTFEFAPSLIDVWQPCPLTASKCQSPQLKLYVGDELVASATLPEIQWTSQSATTGATGAFMASSGGTQVDVPTTVALRAPTGEYTTVAVVKIDAKVFAAPLSSLFLKPQTGKQVRINSQEPLQWLVAQVDTEKTYKFTIKAMKLEESLNPEANLQFRKIGDLALKEIPDSSRLEKLRCQKTALPGIPESATPCSFSWPWFFDNEIYQEGTQGVVLVSWSDGVTVHEMYTQWFEVVSKWTEGRRLSEEDAPARKLTWTSESWNQHIDNNADACTEKDLHFTLGSGLLIRGRMDNFGLPQGFPMLGDLDEEPVLTTDWRRIGGIKEGQDARELFPEILCDGGLCEGALPGCRKAQFEKLHFPRLIFNYSRPYYYNDDVNGSKFKKTIHQLMAYAFSTMPEMVDITIRELNASRTPPRPQSQRWSSGNPLADKNPVQGSNWRQQGSFQTSQTQRPQWSPSPSYSAPSTPTRPPQASAEAKNAFNTWWSGAGRRLHDKEDREVIGHQVDLRFKVGLPYIVDQDLVHMMLQHGYFMPVEDDAAKHLGPIEINGFQIIHHDDRSAVPQEKSQWSLLQVATGSASGMAVVVGLVTASLFVLGTFVSRTLGPRSQSDRGSDAKSFFLDSQDENQGLE